MERVRKHNYSEKEIFLHPIEKKRDKTFCSLSYTLKTDTYKQLEEVFIKIGQ